jgi:hypothetical protein
MNPQVFKCFVIHCHFYGNRIGSPKPNNNVVGIPLTCRLVKFCSAQTSPTSPTTSSVRAAAPPATSPATAARSDPAKAAPSPGRQGQNRRRIHVADGRTRRGPTPRSGQIRNHHVHDHAQDGQFQPVRGADDTETSDAAADAERGDSLHERNGTAAVGRRRSEHELAAGSARNHATASASRCEQSAADDAVDERE